MVMALFAALSVGEWIEFGHRGRTVRTEAHRSLAAVPTGRETASSTADGVLFSPDPVASLRADHARSIDRILEELDARFDGWRDRSETFADSLLGWRTRGSLAWQSLRGALGGDDGRRRRIVRDRFEALVLDERELREAIDRAVARLAIELRADRSRALARVRARIDWTSGSAGSGDAGVTAASLSPLDDGFDAALLREADRSLAGGVAGVIGATVVTELVAVSVGATAGGAAAGAAGGSVVPGAGTAIGFAAGLGAGLAVDWWMHARMRDAIVRRCGEIVERLRCEVIDGDPAREHPGLRSIFEECAERDARRFEANLARSRIPGGAR